MRATFISEVLKKNWYLLLILFVLVVVIAARIGTRDTAPADSTPAKTTTPGAETAPGNSTPTPVPKRLAPDEKTLATIRQHQAELNADPSGEKAPSLLLSMGNLYMQKLEDYDQAIDCYERILEQHPQWDAIQKAFMQLAIAYEKRGNIDKARSVYEEMMRRYPPDSVEYKYAQNQLQAL